MASSAKSPAKARKKKSTSLAVKLSDQTTSEKGHQATRPEGLHLISETLLLDPALLTSIRSLSNPGEKDFLNTLIGMFFKRSPELFANMAEALSRTDADAFERAAHALKGTCGNLGAMKMMKACERLEHIGKSGDLSAVPNLMTALYTLYQEVHDALERDWKI